MRGGIFVCFALLLAIAGSCPAQDVVSASSGVLQYFEGAVLIDDKPVEHKAAVFPSLGNGSVIRTAKGRAELLLTPGVYLRIDENSALRMQSNSLADTRLELTGGSAILDNLNAAAGHAIALIFNDSTVRFPKPGVYRVDSELGELQPYTGEAEVSHRELTRKQVSTTVDSSHLYYFSLGMTISKFGDGTTDEFYDWAHNRSEIIADQNQTASAQQDEADAPDPGGSIFGAPLPFTPPTYPDPSISGPGPTLYGNVVDPLYLNSGVPFFGFPPSLAILVWPPGHRWPVGTRWPPVTGYRPGPIRGHWPVLTQTRSSYIPGTNLGFPARSSYRPPPPLTFRPATVVPRMTVPSAAAHPVAPHVSIGHH